MEKIGFFGGCFNPPTNIHIELANNLVKTKKLDKVIFVQRKVLGNNSHDFRKRKLLRNCAILHSQCFSEWNPSSHDFCFSKQKRPCRRTVLCGQ